MLRCCGEKTKEKTHGFNIPVAETRDCLPGAATTLLHKFHHFLHNRHAFLAAELFHHAEVGFAVAAAALLHHLVHDQTPQ